MLHDELDIPFGDVRLKLGGGHAGHNGLRSIMERVGTGDFGRVRLGVGRPPPGFRGEVAAFVLSGFDPAERAALPDLVKKAGDSVLDIARRGFAPAMNARNTRPKTARRKPKTGAARRRPDCACVAAGNRRNTPPPAPSLAPVRAASSLRGSVPGP